MVIGKPDDQYGELICGDTLPDQPGVMIDVGTALMVDRVEFALDELDLALRSTLDKMGSAPQLGQIRCESVIVSETLDESDRLR